MMIDNADREEIELMIRKAIKAERSDIANILECSSAEYNWSEKFDWDETIKQIVKSLREDLA